MCSYWLNLEALSEKARVPTREFITLPGMEQLALCALMK